LNELRQKSTYLLYNITIKTTHTQKMECTLTVLSKEGMQQKTWNKAHFELKFTLLLHQT